MPEIFQEINWLDILFVILLAGMLYEGLRRGISGQVLSLVGWVAMLFAAVTYYGTFSESIFGSKLQKWSLTVSFFLIAAGIFFAVTVLERSLKIKKEGEISFTERIGGAGLAALRAILLFGVISMQLLLVPVDPVRAAVKEDSRSALFFVDADAQIYSWMTGRFNITRKREKEDIVSEFMTPDNVRKGIIRMR